MQCRFFFFRVEKDMFFDTEKYIAFTPVAVAMDRAGKEVGVDFVGGFSALVHKGATRADHKLMDSDLFAFKGCLLFKRNQN